MTWLYVLLALLVILAVYDLFQRKHAILRNFPIIGHFRYLFELVGPELRQYIVTSNNEERPFSRDERSWVYASSKKQNNYFGFGTDNDLEVSNNYLIVKHSTFPLPSPHEGETGFDEEFRIPCAKVIGRARGRKKAFRPRSVVGIAAMSFGSLSSAAVIALNRGAEKAGCLHNTGEGGISPYHKEGGDTIWQLGTGYYGARATDGGFDRQRFKDTVAGAPNLRAIEVKLSQGAKPGLGGVLPGAKVTAEIAAIRGIPEGESCISPSYHRAFSNADELLDFVEELADLSGGIPVGIKSAVGQMTFWDDLIRLMGRGRMENGRGVDYIQIDGGEGGTGAAPLVFSDHVSQPFKIGFSRVYARFAEAGLTDDIVFMGSGKRGFPEEALLSFALGCDMISVAREAMLAIGCIQAQRCHTGHCPTGVATQTPWLIRGLDASSKADRLANYMISLRKELMWLSHACGVPHPGLITPDHFEIVDGAYHATSIQERFGIRDGWGLASKEDRAEITRIMAERDFVG